MPNVKVVFIGGPRAVTYLNKDVQTTLLSIMNSNCNVVIGDATGVDKLVQQFLNNQGFKEVKVYASNGIVRNNIGNWPVVSVSVPKGEKGFDFSACKDKKMALDADLGFMIWNGESRGTFENIVNLLRLNKFCIVYYIPTKEFITVKDSEGLAKLRYLSAGIDIEDLENSFSQLSLFEN